MARLGRWHESEIAIGSAHRGRVRFGRWLRRAALLAGMIAIAPFLWDGVRVCAANWSAMHGGRYEVTTPAFDAIEEARREVARQCWGFVRPILREPPWKAGGTITLACAWAIAMAWIFRSSAGR